MKIQKELDETKIVLHKTIESVLERGEKIDSLVEKSDGLSAQSKMFYKQGVRILGNRIDELMNNITLNAAFRAWSNSLTSPIALKTYLTCKSDYISAYFEGLILSCVNILSMSQLIWSVLI
ncbi:MAG: hypothetical protein Q9205_000575 [Flavoplaca limonia]